MLENSLYSLFCGIAIFDLYSKFNVFNMDLISPGCILIQIWDGTHCWEELVRKTEMWTVLPHNCRWVPLVSILLNLLSQWVASTWCWEAHVHMEGEFTCCEQVVILKEQQLPAYLRWNLQHDVFDFTHLLKVVGRRFPILFTLKPLKLLGARSDLWSAALVAFGHPSGMAVFILVSF